MDALSKKNSLSTNLTRDTAFVSVQHNTVRYATNINEAHKSHRHEIDLMPAWKWFAKSGFPAAAYCRIVDNMATTM